MSHYSWKTEKYLATGIAIFLTGKMGFELLVLGFAHTFSLLGLQNLM